MRALFLLLALACTLFADPCPKCREELAKEWKYCPKCGAEIPQNGALASSAKEKAEAKKNELIEALVDLKTVYEKSDQLEKAASIERLLRSLQSADLAARVPAEARDPWEVGGPFRSRLPGRKDLVASGGGTQGPGGTELAVSAGLRWLARHQRPNGSWSADEFDKQCAGDTRCAGKGNKDYDTGCTGLALLAFLGAGYSHLNKTETFVDPRSGEKVFFGEVVKRGIKWLIVNQDQEGCFGGCRGAKYMYNHSIASFAIAEAYGFTGGEFLKESAQKGIDFLLQAQNPYKGWRYTKQCGDNDTSVTSWSVMALKAADISGLNIGRIGLEGARTWLKQVTDEQSRKVGYTGKGTDKVFVTGKNEDWDDHLTLTAAGTVCRLFMDYDKLDVNLRGAKLLVADLPKYEDKKIDYYYWYYGSLALFHYDGPDGKIWKIWNKAMKEALVPHQRTEKDGCADGSWDVDVDRWGFEGGRVYATALNVLTLETYYRYPIVNPRK